MDVVAALVLLAVHTAFVWGYTGKFWGDVGRWSHEVERFARGEVPYRDFQWHFPPLALWIEGYAARLIGTGRTQLSIIATSISVVIVMAYVCYVREVLRRVDVAIVMAGLLMALAYVQTGGPHCSWERIARLPSSVQRCLPSKPRSSCGAWNVTIVRRAAHTA